MLDGKIELLQQVPLFAGLSEELLGAVADSGRKTFFQAGDKLIAEGEGGSAAYLIMTGKAGCPQLKGAKPSLRILRPGTLVGSSGCLSTVDNVTVTAQERLRALAFHRDAVRTLMETHPELAQQISKTSRPPPWARRQIRKVDAKLAELEKAANALAAWIDG